MPTETSMQYDVGAILVAAGHELDQAVRNYAGGDRVVLATLVAARDEDG